MGCVQRFWCDSLAGNLLRWLHKYSAQCVGSRREWLCFKSMGQRTPQVAVLATFFRISLFRSNDRGATANFVKLSDYLNIVAKAHPVSLLSLIGGSFFLDMVQAVHFT